jgi:hypothetical protein
MSLNRPDTWDSESCADGGTRERARDNAEEVPRAESAEDAGVPIKIGSIGKAWQGPLKT